MIVKFLSNKNGGGLGSVDYVLDQKRVQNKTARVLKGDEKMTRDLIATITKKQKTSFAVMSFEEANINEALKYELMQEFEKTFFAGLEADQYNILWVEHTDKGRLELNAIIPKVELSTMRAFNPYYHQADLHIKDIFTKSINIKYGFTDPQDPAKSSSVSGSKKEILLFADYQTLDLKLKELVSNGLIQDRAEMIELLKKNNIDVTRVGADYISVKLPESKKARRLNGGIYTEQFTSVDELRDVSREQLKRERAFTGRDRQTEYRDLSQRLERAIHKRALFNAELFSRAKQSNQRREREAKARATDREREAQRVREENERSSQRRSQENQSTRDAKSLGHHKREVEEHDRIRSTVAKYVESRARRSRAREARVEQRARRVEVYASINRQATATDYRAIDQAYRQRELRINIIESLKRLPEVFNRVITSIKELMKPKEPELPELFAHTRKRGLKDAVKSLYDHIDQEQPQSHGLFRR